MLDHISFRNYPVFGLYILDRVRVKVTNPEPHPSIHIALTLLGGFCTLDPKSRYFKKHFWGVKRFVLLSVTLFIYQDFVDVG